jgi:L-ascorbate metabolism protein UlaG (beta-lactamase superfamily)
VHHHRGRTAGPARPLPTWTHIDLPRPNGVGDLRVTAVPAQHGPDGTEHLTGPVAGFVLHSDDLPTLYVSGDNASLRVVKEIAARFPDVDVAILFGGAARTPLLGDANLTLDASEMVEATRILGASTVVPVHIDSWAHFTEGLADIRAAFTAAGLTDLLLVPQPQQTLRGPPALVGRGSCIYIGAGWWRLDSADGQASGLPNRRCDDTTA